MLIVFSPAIFAEYSLVDDAETVSALKSGGVLTFKTLFLPGAKDGGYYRPLIGLSHLLDRVVWQMDSRAVHLENILLHLFNAFWLLVLVRMHLTRDRQDTSCAPLAAALLFALHPVVTESVNWYSGRTDLLAANFALPGVCVLAVWRKNRKSLLLLTSMLLMLLAVLAKESALAVLLILSLFFIPPRDEETMPYALLSDLKVYALFLLPSLLSGLSLFTFWPALALSLACGLILAWRGGRRSAQQSGFRQLTDAKPYILAAVVSIVLAGGLFFGLRQIAYSGRLPRIGATLTLMFQDLDYTIGMFLGGIGFYVKKFFWPLPLNFAIREIDPLYQLFGILICFMTVALLMKRSQWSLFAVMGGVLLLPALPFVFGTIAWTSYAERYMYLSTAFWAGSVALYADGLRVRAKLKQALLMLLIVGMAGLSCWRSVVWRSNLTLLSDTVNNSPGFKDVRAFYMLALFLNKDLEGAEKQYHAASAIPSLLYNPKLDVVYARVLQAQGKTHEARRILEIVLKKSGGTSSDAAKALRELEQFETGRAGK